MACAFDFDTEYLKDETSVCKQSQHLSRGPFASAAPIYKCMERGSRLTAPTHPCVIDLNHPQAAGANKRTKNPVCNPKIWVKKISLSIASPRSLALKLSGDML